MFVDFPSRQCSVLVLPTSKAIPDQSDRVWFIFQRKGRVDMKLTLTGGIFVFDIYARDRRGQPSPLEFRPLRPRRSLDMILGSSSLLSNLGTIKELH